MTIFIKLHFLPKSAWLQGYSLLDIVGIFFQVGMISSPETPDKYGPWLTNLVAFHLTLIFPWKSSFSQQLLPFLLLYSVYAFFHELKCLSYEDVAVNNTQFEATVWRDLIWMWICVQYSNSRGAVGYSKHAGSGALSRVKMHMETSGNRSMKISSTWEFSASAPPSCREGASSREYAITAVYDVLGGLGAVSFCAYGICVGRFLGEGDCTDLINYHRKNSKHH